MALIKEIRQRTGLAIGVIAGGLILFLLGGDLLSPNSTLLNSSQNIVGEIAGEEISYEEYVQRVEEFRVSYQQRTGRAPSEVEMFTVREQAWQAMIVEKVFKEEYDKLGLEISDAELVDMVQGKNIVPELQQQLVNPQTGQFDKTQLVSFLQSLETADPAQQAFWAQQEQVFADSRLRIKYDNLLATSEYATTAEAKASYNAENSIADVEHLFVPFYAVADSSIDISESELSAYLADNQEKFQTGNTANIEYVSFSILPSGIDSASLIEEMNELTAELRDADNDSVFVSRNSESQFPFFTYRPGDNLPASLTNNVDEIEEGGIYGPFVTPNSTYVTYKITEKYDGVPRIRASHILFSTENMSDLAKADVRTQAQEVLNDIRENGGFELAARQYGQDGSAQQGGDLGWFAQEDFVAEFADAAFAQRSTGLINRLVETEYGYHIIDVTELPQSEYTKLAVLELELVASDQTRNEAFRNADSFAAGSGNRNEFTENAEAEGYRIIQANSVDAQARNINNVQSAREVIRWAFSEASEDEVSPVFELDNQYMVASLVSKKEEGDAKLDDVRDQVTLQVRNQKKADFIIEQLKTKTTLEEMQALFPDAASLNATPDLKLSSSVIPGIGFAPAAVGAIFGLQNSGDLTDPIYEDVGVIVAKLNSITPAGEIGDYSGFQRSLTQTGSQRTNFQVMMALQDLADVKDYRYKFF